MATFSTVDRKLTSAVSDLHDYLWVGKKIPQDRLLMRLEEAAADLDRHLGTRGLVSGGVRPLLRDFQRQPGGTSVFEFLHTVGNLAAAVQMQRRRPQESARRAAEVVTSCAIGLAAYADRFSLVEAFQGGKTDFAGFITDLADALEARGVVRAGEFKRAANMAYDIHATWDPDKTMDEQRVAAHAAVAAAAYAGVLHADALRDLGKYRDVPYGRMVPAIRRILEGMHP